MCSRTDSLNLDLLDEVAFSADTSVSDQPSYQFQVQDVATIQKLLKEGQHKQVKDLLRSHNWPVDHPIRKDLWITLCKHHGVNPVRGFYEGMVKELFEKVSTPPSLPSFCDPIYCDSFYLNAQGHQAAERILFIIAYNDPSITYCPLLYPLTCLFLHFMTEEEAYQCVADLLAAKQERFLTQNKMGHDANAYVAMKLTKKYVKQGFIQLQEVKKNPDAILKAYRRWLCWIFRGLPFYHLIRVMDCFLMEGSKVLLRTLLGVLMCLSKYSAGIGNKADVQTKSPSKGLSEKIFNYTQKNLGPVDKFLKVSFGIRGLSRTEIQKCLLKAEMMLKSQSFHQNRRVSMDTAPSTDSLYQLYMSSASINVKEMKVKCQSSLKAGSTGMIALKNFQSDILTSDQMSLLWSWLPTRITMFQPQLLYSTNEHGSSLTAFFMRVDAWEPTLLIIKAMNDEVFGAYCSTSWSTRLEQDESGNQRRYFGTGETFLFTLWPKACKYPWIGVDAKQSVGHSEELFMAANKQWICVGAGNGQGLWLDESLSSGKTEHCDTFRNPSLCSNSDFTCKIVEVAGFE